MRGWRRDLWYDQTGLTWENPSPNIRTMNEAVLYPGLGAIEWTHLSVGRGTDTPFEQAGAPWIDGAALAAALNARHLRGRALLPGVLHARVEHPTRASGATASSCW